MTNWHYYNENREKIGPIASRELKQLVQQGTVTPDTFVEDPTGRTGLAKDVKGLKFPDTETSTPEPFIATPTPFVPTEQTTPTPPVTPPPAANVFCTNCGNTVADQAVACMSCGAKPTGHKKFCRHCAAGLNPEQVVCIKCGSAIGTDNLAASLMAGVKRAIPPDTAASLMTGVKRIIPSNVATSIPEKIKKLPKPAIIAGVAIVATLCLTLFIVNINNSIQRPSELVGKWQVVVPRHVVGGELELLRNGTAIFRAECSYGEGFDAERERRFTWRAKGNRLYFTDSGRTDTSNYRISGATLTLTDDGGNSTTFRRK